MSVTISNEGGTGMFFIDGLMMIIFFSSSLLTYSLIFLLTHYKREITVMLRKVSVVCISIFFKQYGAVTQALMASLLIFFTVAAHIETKPFENDTLNNVETFGLVRLSRLCMFLDYNSYHY